MGTSSDQIEVNYDGLREVSRQFDQESQAIQVVIQQTHAKLDALMQTEWKGAGADAFYSEMQSSMLPGCTRLVKALEDSSHVTDQIIRVFQDGEAEAAGMFNGGSGGNNIGGAGNGGAGTGNSGDAASQTSNYTSTSSGPSGQVGLSLDESLHLKDFGQGQTLMGGNGADKKPDILGVHVGLVEGHLYENQGAGTGQLGGLQTGIKHDIKVGAGSAGIGFGLDGKGQAYAGAYAGVTGFDAEGSAAVALGVAGLGVGVGGAVKALDGEAFFGYKDGEVGAKIGGDLVSAEGTVGLNVGDHNVGVTGKVGVGFELGLKVGEKTEIDLGPFEVGLEFGDKLGFASPE